MTGLPLKEGVNGFFSEVSGAAWITELTVDEHVEKLLEGGVFVTGRELVDPALGAEDPHQSDFAQVSEQMDAR